MNGWQTALLESAGRLGVTIDRRMVDKFSSYMQLILNAGFNLVSFQCEEELAVRHFADSLACIRLLPGETSRCIDIGSGAGLPGIPLKIVRPDIHVSLLESVGKKARFIRSAVSALGLDGVEVYENRAEELARQEGHRESYDAVVSRAAAPAAVALEYMLPLSRVGGCAVLFLGLEDGNRLGEHSGVMDILGGRTGLVEEYCLEPGESGRIVARVDKVQASSDKYPRRTGIPAKRPLGSI